MMVFVLILILMLLLIIGMIITSKLQLLVTRVASLRLPKPQKYVKQKP